jgi:hypothetical protein
MATPKKEKHKLAEMYRLGIGTGRPPLFNTPTALSKKINEYFDHCDESNQPPTITGLSLFCGFSDRRSFYDYQDDKPEFSHVTRAARTVIANFHEINVATTDKPQGSIFMLKNFGFSDTQVIEHTGKAEVRQTFKIGKTVIEF